MVLVVSVLYEQHGQLICYLLLFLLLCQLWQELSHHVQQHAHHAQCGRSQNHGLQQLGHEQLDVVVVAQEVQLEDDEQEGNKKNAAAAAAAAGPPSGKPCGLPHR